MIFLYQFSIDRIIEAHKINYWNFVVITNVLSVIVRPLSCTFSRHLCTSLSYGSAYLSDTRPTLHKRENSQQKQLLDYHQECVYLSNWNLILYPPVDFDANQRYQVEYVSMRIDELLARTCNCNNLCINICN